MNWFLHMKIGLFVLPILVLVDVAYGDVLEGLFFAGCFILASCLGAWKGKPVWQQMSDTRRFFLGCLTAWASPLFWVLGALAVLRFIVIGAVLGAASSGSDASNRNNAAGYYTEKQRQEYWKQQGW